MISRLRISGLALGATALLGTTLVAQDRGAGMRNQRIILELRNLDLKPEGEAKPQGADGSGQLRFEPVRNLSLERRPPSAPEAGGDLDGFEDDLPEDERPREGPIDLKNHILDRASFDRWLFGNMETDELRGRWLSQLLEEEIARLGRNRGLTEAQKAKLRLAGKGDIKRFYIKVAKMKKEFETARQDVGQGARFLQQMNPLCLDFQAGPFRGESLVMKTFRFMTE